MTLFEVYKDSIKQLKNPDVGEINVRILLCEINSLNSMSEFYLKKDEDIRDLQKFYEYFKRFLNGEPVQYILGKTEFLGNEILVDKRVLIPRQESEEVVTFTANKIKEIFGDKKVDILDVCCGSGVMGITLSKMTNCNNLILSDTSNDALCVAKKNLTKNNITATVFCGNALDEIIKNNVKCDVVIANPPYILKSEKVDDSVLKYEPSLALFTDEDFSIYRNIIDNLHLIKKNILLAVFEIGANTRNVIEQFLINKYPDYEFEFKKDMNGKERILYIVIR